MAYVPIIAPVTELDAVNLMLAAGGEAPVPTIVGQRPDVVTAQSLLKQASREIQAEGWRFNTEHGLGLKPTVTDYVWTDNTGATVKLNIFVPAANLLSFTTTATDDQQGSRYTDAVIRPSVQWTPGTLVFYDRAANRDGWCRRTQLYIDPVWLFDFEKLPQEARTLIVTRATRYYVRSVVNDPGLANTYMGDEAVALRSMKRNHGLRDDYNIFNNAAVAQHRGGRMGGISYVRDRRANPGPQ